MIWIQNDNRTRWVRLSEDPRKTSSVHAWFYEGDRPVNHYILRASYICENYTLSTLTLMEMKTWQQVIKHAGNADSGATHQDAVTGTHRVHRRRMN